MSARPRMIGMLVGNLQRQPDMRTKYGPFFEAVARQFELVDVYDASLKGLDRWINAARVFHFQRKKWKERFFKNIPAFKLRSARAAQYLERRQGQYDYVLQLGALFDASLASKPDQNLIYSDYTSALSARNPLGERSPFNPGQLAHWQQLEQQAYQHAGLLFARSEMAKKSFIEDYAVPAEKIIQVGGGVNFASLPPRAIAREAEHPTALFIGSDFHRKGGDILLQAFAEVHAQLPLARLLVLTKNPIPSGLPLGGVTVLPSAWNRATIESVYRQAHILVLPSRLETWGDVLLEAMAYEMPCIGVTGQAMEDIITPQVTGLLVPPADPSTLGKALIELLSNPGLQARYGQAGRDRIETHFTWDHVVAQMASQIDAHPSMPASERRAL